MKKALAILLFGGAAAQLSAQTGTVTSPGGEIKLEYSISDKLRYSILCEGDILMKDNSMSMTVDGGVLGENPKLTGRKTTAVNETVTPVVPLKFSSVANAYNRLTLTFRGGYSVEFRVFDDGVAWRFATDKKGDIEVAEEDQSFNFPSEYLLHLQQPGGFKTAYEEPYTHVKSGEWKPADKMSTLPLLADAGGRYKMLISETDVSDYPAMFLAGNGNNGVVSKFPKAPIEFGEDGDRSLKIVREASYIAKTTGTRTFPWRYCVITKDDRRLVENTMPYRLAPQNVLDDVSWLKPGQVSWEWWNDASPYGPDVDFVSGYNLDTYKYYIDFASRYGIEYIIMDEGWAASTRDPYTPNPGVDLHELVRYGREKNVGVVLWLTWLTVENNPELFETFARWGVKGVKIDFMDRSDQWMMNFYERVAREAARHKLFVDYHGAISPKGLEHKYPNIISYEGVRGMEQMGGCTPDNSVWFPFMRNVVGAMDYTPGAMISMQPRAYAARRPNSASIGTRAYQMALFVVFESGLQMLADNPTLYYRNPDCTEFIASVPTTWDETRALEARAGEYVVVAKRKGDRWFIGGMTNNGEDERNFTVGLDFLDPDGIYTITSFEDGINAGRQAMDYRKKSSQVRRGDSLNITMARNGGFAAVIEPAAPLGLLLDKERYRHYIDRFNADDNELYRLGEFPNERAWEFLAANIPFFDCPDKQLEQTYYFRWWTYRKHIRHTPEGYIITEFLPNVGWAGQYNSISCPAAHHFMEGRWLRDSRYLKDYARFWFNGVSSPRSYSFWAADAISRFCEVHPDEAMLRELFPLMERNYAAWEQERLDENGLFWQKDDRDGMEESISGSYADPNGNGYRATINSYMYADARALEKLAAVIAPQKETLYRQKAETIRKNINNRLWDPDAGFYKVIPVGRDGSFSDAREQHGYTPWYFNIPDDSHSEAWKYLMDSNHFFAPYGITTAEQCHPKFVISYEGHECRWNGPSWPFSTSITLTAMANLLNNYSQPWVSTRDYLALVSQYSRSHSRQLPDGRTVPWIDENLNPYTGDWISRTRLESGFDTPWPAGKGGVERGKDYNHSTFNDLIITGLVGIRPADAGHLTINPLVPAGAWEYFCLDDLCYRGKTISACWDSTGKRYGRGAGFSVWVDGEEVHRSQTTEKVTIDI
jgi:alpha-glucosidase